MVVSNPSPSRQPVQGFVLVTVLMVLILFTGASVTTLYSVTKSIKATGYMRQRVETFEWGDGGMRRVFGELCEYSVTELDELKKEAQTTFASFSSYLTADTVMIEATGTKMQFMGEAVELRSTRRSLPKSDGLFYGRDILLTGYGYELGTGKRGSTSEMLVFVARDKLPGSGVYGPNE